MPADPRRYLFCGVPIRSELDLPALRRARGAGPAACLVRMGNEADTDADVEWFHEWRGRRGPRWLAIGRPGGDRARGYLLRFPTLADFEVSAGARRIVARPMPALPVETLRHLLIDQVLPLVMSRHGRLSLHASAVHLAGVGTIGFVGETGRGKSTLAAALALGGARVVADDCLAIETRGGGVFAVPAYPGLRLWPKGAGRRLLIAERSRRVAHYSTKRRVAGGGLPYHAGPSPLRALFLLRPRASRGPAAEITRCGPSARLIGLLRYAYVLDVEDRVELAAVFDRLAAAVGRVPVLRLRVRHGASRLDAAAETIREYMACL
jgi:hypothetical protein